MNSPILTTERLTLRQLSTDDHQNIFLLRSDAEINKYLGRQPSKTIEDAISFVSMINENIPKGNSIYWVITLTATKTFVGTICLFDFSKENSSCEIGYELMTKFQGQGIMKEALTSVIDYAFRILKFKKIIAYTHSENQNSTKLLNKLNFIESFATDKENTFTVFTLIDKD
ncbi:MAG: GNAT family N-acetyltransferase [Bacteroidota bacterium]